jgi:TPP-dependent pyruvate/acetoin dehydrogenase alpha subunit
MSEESSQSIGAMYKGRPCGSFGDYGCYSFYPSKNLGAIGDGGLIVTDHQENNQVALGTRLEQHHVADDFASWPDAYGMAGGIFDGNNVLDAYAAAALAVDQCRSGQGPVLLVAETFRMGGHATHDEREARETFPAELFESWGRRDPIGLYEEYLKEEGVAQAELEETEARATAEIERSAEEALASRDHLPDPASALRDVYAE